MSCLSTPLRFLPVLPAELQLSTVLKSGQSFRWNKSTTLYATRPDHTTTTTTTTIEGGEEWSFGWQERTVVLRQDDLGVHYRSLYPFSPPDHTAYLTDLEKDTTRQLLIDYFQLSTPLSPLYERWSLSDPKFRNKLDNDQEEGKLKGIRVLKQDEWETLVSFICSANNNIPRITLMIQRLCTQLGSPLPHPTHFTPSTIFTPSSSIPSPTPPPNEHSLYSFPPPSALQNIPRTESLLRQLGFGYRANFIPVSTSLLLSKPPDYLLSLGKGSGSGLSLSQVREKLLEFKGVGRKVADCIMLFGLGWDEIVPVDTHVFQIAIRDYSYPASKTTALTPKLHDSVSEHLSRKWAPYAGWAQQILFFADLKSTNSSPVKVKKEYKEEIVDYRMKLGIGEEGEVKRERKKTFEEQVKEIMDSPGRKRRRITTVVRETVKVEVKDEERELESVVAIVKEEDESSELSEMSDGEQQEEEDEVVRKVDKVKKGNGTPKKKRKT